jgi:hypothetical protein
MPRSVCGAVRAHLLEVELLEMRRHAAVHARGEWGGSGRRGGCQRQERSCAHHGAVLGGGVPLDACLRGVSAGRSALQEPVPSLSLPLGASSGGVYSLVAVEIRCDIAPPPRNTCGASPVNHPRAAGAAARADGHGEEGLHGSEPEERGRSKDAWAVRTRSSPSHHFGSNSSSTRAL